MRSDTYQSVLIKLGLAAIVLLLTSAASFAQQTVNLKASATWADLPDGSTVPMWGYSCGNAGTGGATCALSKNPSTTMPAAWAPSASYQVGQFIFDTTSGTVQQVSVAGTSGIGPTAPVFATTPGAATIDSSVTWVAFGTLAQFQTGYSPTWSPVVIRATTGSSLTINLTNGLSFLPPGTSGPNTVPTSLVIVGQLGGGLGSVAASCNPVSPAVATATGSTCTPSPAHGSSAVTWSTVTPGTFSPPAQGARVQSFSTEVVAGATTALTWNNLNPGTYLIESGTHPSIQGPMGLYGMLIVTTPPAGSTLGTAYGTVGAATAVTYSADVPLLLSEIDPVQNNAVTTAVNTAGFSETKVWSGQPGQCGNPNSPVGVVNTCYPPAVNYTPLYYLFNGVAFDKTNAAASVFPAALGAGTAPATNVLVRLVNAGLRMHVPSIVGSQTGVAPSGGTAPTGFSLIAEDGNPAPGLPHVQNEVFMAAGKTFDVLINAPTAAATALPVYDRELSLSGNSTARDAGMLAYISINGAAAPAAAAFSAAVARADTYKVVPGNTLVVSDPSKGVIANDTNVYGVAVLTAPTKGTLTLNANGTFTYVPNAGWSGGDFFVYMANGSPGVTAQVTLGAATIESAGGITVNPVTFNANVAGYLSIETPGVLAGARDAAGYPLTVVLSSVTPQSGLNVSVSANGGFVATLAAPNTTAATYTFTYLVQNSQGTKSAGPATATINFPAPGGLSVSVVDGGTKAPLAAQDYRWIIEEDRTFYVDPNCTTNPPPAGCPTAASGIVPTFGTNFHTSNMPYVAQGCTGPQSCEAGQTVFDPVSKTHVPAVCDVGNGVCRTGTQRAAVNPSQVALDPSKRYYISVLPGDAADPFYSNATNGVPGVGHGMGGAPIPAACTLVPPATTCTGSFAPVTVLSEQSPYPPGKLSVLVFEDDFPLNGEQDAGGGIDVLATQEPGLGGFNIVLMDDMGGSGDPTGQMTYDMFNQPLSNALAGTVDPVTGVDACPISKNPLNGPTGNTDPTATGITGMIVTCPRYEADGVTLSPLGGQAVVANLMPGRFSVIATPGADRIARGEEWLQTNTLDGQKAQDSFIRIGEPVSFQEFGPAGYHVSIGFANPKIINSRLPGVCAGADPFVSAKNCTNTVTGSVTTMRLSRTPDERLYSSGSHDSFYFTQCFVSLGDPDGEDFAFTKCNPDGTFSLSGLPDGSWRITVFDQWNDMLVDGLSTPVLTGGGKTTNLGEIAMNQWQANVYTRTFIDDNRDGISQSAEAGIPLINTAVRYRDGSLANNLVTDFSGNANFNETFPLFNWYVVETDTTRYKTTGIHTVYDAGGPADGSTACGQPGYPPCGTSVIGKYLANTHEPVPLPANLSVPGAIYCPGADCTGLSIANGSIPSSPTNYSTGRIDPPWVPSEGWQGFTGQNNFIEFGKSPYAANENGGIKGHVVYASTRPFDDPMMLVQTQWEPLVPHVTLNLYQEGTAPDGSLSLTLVDTTQTSSFDDWAQGFRSDGIPNMNCPGQSTADLFYFSLYNQPNYLNTYTAAHGGPAPTPLPYNSQFKCYDGMHNWNQVQPAPYDGVYSFPSVLGRNPHTGNTTGTNCSICVKNPDPADAFRFGKEDMLPPGKYVVEVVLPPGYELVKEEDKNILIGDNFIAPVTQQFGSLGNVFIIPDQAAVASYWNAGYNANNAQNPTNSFGTAPNNGIVPGFVPEPTWPCVGQARIVPDYISLFPQSKQVAPFAGALRNLCDRKEVTLGTQMGAIAKFFVYTSTHIGAKFAGVITDDFTSEFDPFSPQFGEKFSPPDMPVSVKDWTGGEVSRVYSDHWGTYNGMTYSTWEVNPPNPTGYSPTMLVFCMNDAGPIPGPSGTLITDPLFNPAYSQFCYELPFMPGLTAYLDTPVVPTSAFAGAGYNNPDCNYPDATPAISEVDGDGIGPWVSKSNVTLTIKALGDQTVANYAYSGPSATTAPFNQKTVKRHYGFGTQCTSPTSGSATCSTLSSVTIGGVPATITSWGDATITVAVPAGVPSCGMQQQAQYGGVGSQCGELTVTAGNGKQSIDAVTVTIGGKAPTHVLAGGSIQNAIDAAAPGDLIIVNPGTYTELVQLWKPLRLQGAGAASTIINANAHPAGKLNPWRARADCLFGLALNGQPLNPGAPITFPPTSVGPIPSINTNSFDPTGAQSCPGAGWNYFTGSPNNPQVDRIPLEATIGWDTSLNGNLAEQLHEPSLMGAYEGAGITVLAKGVKFPNPPGQQLVNVFGIAPDTAAGSLVAHEGQFPVPSVELTGGDCGRSTSPAAPDNPYPSNFQCNPSRIDGLSIANSSQGGGGIFVHGWAHNLEIANNRIYNNTGTLTGGITVGQGESPDALLANNHGDPVGYNGGALAAFDQQPWTCIPGAVIATTATPFGWDQVANPPGTVPNQQLPYCYNLNVNIHNNAVTLNSSIGDELFASTPAGAGGVSFCTGSDYYKFNYNWVCGNLSTGDGGGLAQIGFSYNGDIEHNSILFNQSTNPTVPTNGGGIIIMGAAPDGSPTAGGAPDPTPGLPGNQAECGSTTDVDCAPGLSDGTGPGLVVNANLIIGNAADSGSGGGLRLQDVNGTEVVLFPATPSRWNSVSVSNNIIANNVAGWDGAGVSLQDALVANVINNTIVANDTTASSGVLFNTLGAPLASAPGATNQTTSATTSAPQPAGLVTMMNTTLLTSSLPTTVTCPVGHGTGGTGSGGLTNGACRNFSYPLLENNVFWQNRSFYIGVGALSAAYQQNVVSLYNAFTTTPAASQTATGACVSGSSFWDIGVRGDTGPSNHASGLTLSPMWSVLTDASDYPGLNNTGTNPTVLSQYCNGSRVPPENGGLGYQVPPGISDATSPNPIFNLTPSATVDEGNNWVNMTWGPLTLSNPITGVTLGNYGLAAGSPAIDYVPTSAGSFPSTDFFGNPRPDPAVPNRFDVGAVEFQGSGAGTVTSISPNTGARGSTVSVTITGSLLTGATAVNISGSGITVSAVTAVNATTVTATFTIAPTATLSARNVTVTTPAGTTGAATFTVVAPPVPTLTSIAPNSGLRGSSVPVTLTGTNFSAGSTVAITAPANGVSVSGVTLVSATTITATISSTTGATLGAVNVEVVTPGGASNTLPFTVTGPVLTSIAPASALRGNPVSVTLTGTGLTGTSAIAVSGGGVTVTGLNAMNDGTVTATFVISSGAPGGARNVTVTTPAGTSNAVTFTVLVPPAGLFSMAPNTGARGTSEIVTLTGISLTGATAVSVSGGGITVSGITVVSDSTATATFTISAAAALTARNVTVTSPAGTTTPVTFTVVLPGTPILSSITPAAGLRGTSVPVTLTGSNFTATGTTVTVAAPTNGVAVTGVTVVNSTTITATINSFSTATLGARSISVVTPGGASGTVTFTVTGPALTSIAPASDNRAASVAVTLLGSGLTGATAISVSGGGVTVSGLTVMNDSTVSATFAIAAGATASARNVTVNAPGGTSNSVTFTVIALPVPTLTSIAPATGVRGTTVPVTLTGTNLTGATAVTVSGSGVAVSGLTVTSPSTATATFTISIGATLSARTVSITVPGGGTSNTVPFTVQGATLVSISPTSGTHPASGTVSVPVTITGSNLTGATGLTGLGGGGGGVSVAPGTFTVVNSTTVTATLNIASTATLGFRNIGVATSIGNTNTVPFTVN